MYPLMLSPAAACITLAAAAALTDLGLPDEAEPPCCIMLLKPTVFLVVPRPHPTPLARGGGLCVLLLGRVTNSAALS
jgi:hypothetical protein